jgi:hypothetical protein
MKTKTLILLSLICVPFFLKAQSVANTKNEGYTLALLTDEHDSDVITGRSSLNSLGLVDVCVTENGTNGKTCECTNSQGKPITFPNLAKGKYTVTCTKQNYISASCVVDIGASVYTCVSDKSENAKFNWGSNISDDKVYNLYVTMQPK